MVSTHTGAHAAIDMNQLFAELREVRDMLTRLDVELRTLSTSMQSAQARNNELEARINSISERVSQLEAQRRPTAPVTAIVSAIAAVASAAIVVLTNFWR